MRLFLIFFEKITVFVLSYGQNPELFVTQLEPIFMNFMKDRTAVVRENGVEKLAQLIGVYKEWALTKLFNKLLEGIAKENGYLYRITAIQSLRVQQLLFLKNIGITMFVHLCFDEKYSKVLALNISPDTATEKIIPILIKHTTDTVANIRFVSVRILKELC